MIAFLTENGLPVQHFLGTAQIKERHLDFLARFKQEDNDICPDE